MIWKKHSKNEYRNRRIDAFFYDLRSTAFKEKDFFIEQEHFFYSSKDTYETWETSKTTCISKH